MLLKELRLEKNLTQEEVAKLLGISRRTYIKYETGQIPIDSLKYKVIYETINKYGYIDETHGILSIDSISKICKDILNKYNIDYCFLFGSYAKGYAKETSDIDLLIGMELDMDTYFEIAEELRNNLHKNIDLIHETQLTNNMTLTKEILREGIKIYG